jgi:hypothetical protein
MLYKLWERTVKINGREPWAQVPAAEYRSRFPLRVEFAHSVEQSAEDDDSVQRICRVVEVLFRQDSVLVGVVRGQTSHRVVVYTAAPRMAVARRLVVVRGVLHPLTVHFKWESDPAWTWLVVPDQTIGTAGPDCVRAVTGDDVH